jgi:hypothetical protein
MMVIRNLSEFRKRQEAKIRQIADSKIDSTYKIARVMQLQARVFAPYQTGQLIKNITVTKIPNGHRVMSTVTGDFPYNRWVNGDIPVHQPYWSKDAIRYGQPTKTISGRDVKWTGQFGFFEKAKNVAVESAEKIFRDELTIIKQ